MLGIHSWMRRLIVQDASFCHKWRLASFFRFIYKKPSQGHHPHPPSTPHPVSWYTIWPRARVISVTPEGGFLTWTRSADIEAWRGSDLLIPLLLDQATTQELRGAFWQKSGQSILTLHDRLCRHGWLFQDAKLWCLSCQRCVLYLDCKYGRV